MSTVHVPFAFYGRYFPSRADAKAFLDKYETDYDSDSIMDESSTTLGLQCLRENCYILGFPLQAGQSEEVAKALWAGRLDANGDKARSHFEICTY